MVQRVRPLRAVERVGRHSAVSGTVGKGRVSGEGLQKCGLRMNDGVFGHVCGVLAGTLVGGVVPSRRNGEEKDQAARVPARVSGEVLLGTKDAVRVDGA